MQSFGPWLDQDACATARAFCTFLNMGGQCSVTGGTAHRRPTRFSDRSETYPWFFLRFLFKIAPDRALQPQELDTIDCVVEIEPSGCFLPFSMCDTPSKVVSGQARSAPLPSNFARYSCIASLDTFVSPFQVPLHRLLRCHCIAKKDACRRPARAREEE